MLIYIAPFTCTPECGDLECLRGGAGVCGDVYGWYRVALDCIAVCLVSEFVIFRESHASSSSRKHVQSHAHAFAVIMKRSPIIVTTTQHTTHNTRSTQHTKHNTQRIQHTHTTQDTIHITHITNHTTHTTHTHLHRLRASARVVV